MELYSIPFENKFIIYRPLRGLAFIGNSGLVKYIKNKISKKPVEHSPEVENFLDSIGFWNNDFPQPQVWEPSDEYSPSTAVLLMTGDCNLRCTYCYARGGDDASLNMTFPLARKVIDEVYKNALSRGKDSFSLSFHGGGEPTMNWQVLKVSVEYALKKALPCKITMSSNGIWNDQQRDFIIKYFHSVNISFDGLKEIQEKQRPLISGGSSYDSVMTTIESLDRSGFSYGIRITALPSSFNIIPQNIKFLCEKTNCNFIQVEPCYSNMRGEYKDPGEKEIHEFSQGFIQAVEIASKYKRHLFYSGARPWLIASTFCTGPKEALVVTPEGDIVACFEAHDRRHPLLSRFLTGKVSSTGVEIDIDKIKGFAESQKCRREKCDGCFCYWHCGGDCASRCMSSKDENKGRCEVNRIITRELLALNVAAGNGIWDGHPKKFVTIKKMC